MHRKTASHRSTSVVRNVVASVRALFSLHAPKHERRVLPMIVLVFTEELGWV